MVIKGSADVFVATGSNSTAEIISQMLIPEFERLIICTSTEHVVKEFDASGACVLVLAYNEVVQSGEVYDLLCRHSKKINLLPHKALLLCNKHEAKVAYDYCRDGKFDNYVVFWPLSYDPFRLLMSIHQALVELDKIHHLREKDKVTREQRNHLVNLEALLARQLKESSNFTLQVNHAVDRVEGYINDTFMAKHGDGWRKSVVFDLEQLRGGIKSIRKATRDFDSFSHQSDRTSRRLNKKRGETKASILVVEDDAFQRNLLVALLRSDDYDVQFSASGEEAIGMLQHSTPDLILMDIMMPGINGIETTRLIKTSPLSKNIPIIITSGYNQRDVILECINLGACSFIIKPFNRQTIIKKVAAALESSSSV
ncbi:response regulator [Oceanimonas pelagia]|uniref:Response regulator n=1 Tax=Oceanimonas pelagia TaxID=3028314 RepID=A0AA50QDQ3_9GAMM|nr:response regulator [Oceanimonas pelagia]WMC12414.1 response regulator [Oceanimonas pelagia]